MFTKILVPLDGTPQSNAALPLARTVAGATGAAIALLRVLPNGEPSAVAAARHQLEKIALELSNDGARVTPVVSMGDAVPQILEEIRTQAADLIVMRTHGRVGVPRAVLGSVTEGVLRESAVPVLLMRPGGRPITHIRSLLVPLDGSPGGAVALGIGAGLAHATGAAITLLRVTEPMPIPEYTPIERAAFHDFDPAALDLYADTSAHDYVDDIAARLRSAGLTVEGHARLASHVATEIMTVANETSADLIVMSTHALTGTARVWFGSIADAVVRGAPCPVVLLHRAEVDMDAESEAGLATAVSR